MFITFPLSALVSMKLLDLIKHLIHSVGVIQHQHNVPKFGQLRMPPHLQRPGTLSGGLDLDKAHPAAREEDNSIWRS